MAGKLPDTRAFVGPGGLPLDDAVRYLTDVVRAGVEFKQRKQFLPPASPDQLAAIATEPLPEKGTDADALLDELRLAYLPLMPNFSSPMFMGFPDSGNNIAAIAGALLGQLVNVNMINSTFCSQGATEMEIALIRWLRELIGYEVSPEAPNSSLEVGGVGLSGGTLANFIAVLCARQRAFPAANDEGLPADLKQAHVYMPARIAHYTMRAALAWSGLGRGRTVYSPIVGFKYDLRALDARLAAARKAGEKAIMGVAYAGDSRTMTIDDLTGVAETFRRYYPDIWLHCDGCHGTSLLFAREHASQLQGIELFDSVTLDPHKVLNVPYASSFLLLREPDSAALVRTESDLIMRQARSLGQITPALGSKPFASLRTWALIKSLGREGVGALISDRLGKAQRFAELIDTDPFFVRLNAVNINSVVFVVNPEGHRPHSAEAVAEVSRLTRRVYEQMVHEGRVYLHSFETVDSGCALSEDSTAPVHVLRFMSGNPLLTDEHMRSALDYIRATAEAIMNESPA